ncbi:MAG: hypothetical protein JW839_10475 [Candidatus Lokiarchaeota archaeon]|nr:hypothetical protein [Candidatus Lokiarchaeota archaeon]
MLQEIVPEAVTKEGDFIVYHFPWKMFKNPRYTIPRGGLDLFHAFINGGSRSYSSDGQVPAILAAIEAQAAIQAVRDIAADKEHPFYTLARAAVAKGKAQVEDWEVVRGTIGLMLGSWMPDDWQKKRYTDDIDFYWEAMDGELFAHVLRKLGWTTSDRTPGNSSIWKKTIPSFPGIPLECTNDTVIGKEFGGVGPAVEGPGLKGIVKKKLDRCHEVDISDVINVAIAGHLNIDEDEPRHPWRAVMEILNRISADDCAHLILVCQYAFSIVQYYRDVGQALETHTPGFLSKKVFSDEEIKGIYMKQTPVVAGGGQSYFWEPFIRGSASTVTEMRRELYNYFTREGWKRILNGSRLNTFAHALNWSMNRRYRRQRVRFVITKRPSSIEE